MFVYFDQNGTLKEIISDKTFRVGDSKRDKIIRFFIYIAIFYFAFSIFIWRNEKYQSAQLRQILFLPLDYRYYSGPYFCSIRRRSRSAVLFLMACVKRT